MAKDVENSDSSDHVDSLESVAPTESDGHHHRSGSKRKRGGSGDKNKGAASSKHTPEQEASRKGYRRAAMLLMLMAVGAFIAAYYFGAYVGETRKVLKIPAVELRGGKIIGKIEAPRDHASYQIEVSHPIDYRHQYSQITGEVLDANQNTLFAFGEELWAEVGENKRSFSANFNFPKKDTYYLRLSVEMPPKAPPAPSVEISYGQTAGSGVMFIWLAVFAAFCGFCLWFVKAGGGTTMWKAGKTVLATMLVLSPFLIGGVIIFLCIYFDVDCSD